MIKNTENIADKKGAEKIISIYWFFILFIVAGGVIYMVILFYGEPYDVREIEANLLVNSIADCISEAGFLREQVLNKEFRDNFLEVCRINFNVEDFQEWKNEEQYYLHASFYNFDTESFIFDISEGNINLEEFCKEQYKGQKNNPVCISRSFYSLDKQGGKYKINIIGAVRKTEKNAR
ncbi:MAG TPA: hypothetical protein VJH65_03290 [Candidatus Nanoarchaeia archaeon]|nr:hypothetical protein [Candidatus Nanoarchaeia archaeon]